MIRKSNDFLVQDLHPEFLILTDPNITRCDRNRGYGNRKLKMLQAIKSRQDIEF